MLRTIDRYKNDRGYILLLVVIMMLAMAIMAFGMNRRAGMQAKMSANQIRSSQIHLGQIAALEEAAWTLNLNPTWRTSGSGQPYIFDGITYTRKVQEISRDGYSDVVTITVTTPEGTKELTASYRIIPPTVISVLIADTDNHRIRKVDRATGLITTFAGNGSSGYSGDGGPATDARINYPKGVYADQSGNVFIADTSNHRVRKVDTDGNITTFAGNGSSGHAGDGGPAINASLDEPTSIAMDGLGNIYIADSQNHCIRMVDTDGNISTVAGTPGSSGYSGDTGPATSAQLNEPSGVYVDASKNVFIADTLNCMIRKVDADTGEINRVAGAESGGPSCGYSGDGGLATNAELNKPRAVYVDIDGNIYIADEDNHRIRKVDTDGNIDTVAGNGVATYGGDGGPATSASVQNPKGVWVDEDGRIYIADTENNRVRRTGAVTGNMYTAAGNGSAGYSGDDGLAINAALKKPHAVCLHKSPSPAYLFIADPSNYQIRKVDLSTGFLVKAAGTLWSGYNGDNIYATSARLNYPFGSHADSSGNIYIADTYNHRIRKVNRTTGIITTVAGKGSKGFTGDGGPATNARLRYPFSVYLDTYENIFILDTYNYRIRKVDAATGIITTVVGDGHHRFRGDGGPATSASIDRAYDLAVDNDGNIYIADSVNDVIRKVDATTGIIDTVAGQGKSAGYTGDGGLATNARLNNPTGVHVDSAGNIYIGDSNNNVVRKVDATTQIITTIAGSAGGDDDDDDDDDYGDGGLATNAVLDYPEGIWVDRGGNLFIVDTDHCRVRRVDATTQIIDTVAGTTFCGYNGNNLMATDAALYYPSDICVYEPTGLERLPEVY